MLHLFNERLFATSERLPVSVGLNQTRIEVHNRFRWGRNLCPRLEDRVKEIEHLRSENWILSTHEDEHLTGGDNPLRGAWPRFLGGRKRITSSGVISGLWILSTLALTWLMTGAKREPLKV